MIRTKAFTKISLSIFLLLLASAGNLSAAGKIEIKNPWVREAPPNAKVMAAYFSLHNHSVQGKILISASSPDFKRAELHRTEEHDGMAKMVAVHRLNLDSKGSIDFKPGGLHIMLINPKKSLKAGDSISLTLFFTDESSLKISVPVKKAAATMGHNMDHSMHGDQHKSHSHQH